jgi:hypothetical protein
MPCAQPMVARARPVHSGPRHVLARISGPHGVSLGPTIAVDIHECLSSPIQARARGVRGRSKQCLEALSSQRAQTLEHIPANH